VQELQRIVHNKMQQMDFEPGAAEDQAWCEMDLRQNSMLLSVTKELPRFEPEGVKKKDLDPKRKVFPRDRWFKPAGQIRWRRHANSSRCLQETGR
jgi:hypothetical protein